MTSTLLMSNGVLLFVPAPTLSGYLTDATGIPQLCPVPKRLMMALFQRGNMGRIMPVMSIVHVLVVQRATTMLLVDRLKLYKLFLYLKIDPSCCCQCTVILSIALRSLATVSYNR